MCRVLHHSCAALMKNNISCILFCSCSAYSGYLKFFLIAHQLALMEFKNFWCLDESSDYCVFIFFSSYLGKISAKMCIDFRISFNIIFLLRYREISWNVILINAFQICLHFYSLFLVDFEFRFYLQEFDHLFVFFKLSNSKIKVFVEPVVAY